MRHFLQRFFFPLLLVLLTLLICILNYTPGTWLTGWDTLHPEFDLSLSFSHLIFGVWRWDQGLGAVAAHSHMSELPRLFILWIFSFFSPTSVLRYLYMFLCFILGPLGVYVFLKRTILGEKTFAAGIAAFLGALFYIFNLGTVQQFYVPFEMFMAQYAALGWLFYFATEYMIYQKRRYVIPFAIVSFFASSMAYASLLWYAFLGGFILYLLTICVIVKRKHLIRAAIILLITVFFTNAYWILPNVYFLRNHAFEVPNATTNLLFSEEAFLYNKEYGTVQDTVIFKGFLFDWNEQIGSGLIFEHKTMEAWIQHLSNPFILGIGYFAFLFVLGGVFIAFFDKTASRQTLKMAMFPLGLFAFLMIINMNPPFSYITDILRDKISLFREGLRFPWTKFSILLMFAMSVYFGICWQWILKKITNKTAHIALVVVMSGLLALYCWPMFQGQFIDKQLRVAIPQEYFSLFQWFKTQPATARVAPLPMHSPWGWEYYDWGYQGSGFMWFGLQQPYLARDFDRWNPANEQYYREMSTAFYSRDVKAVESLADKYHIGYFILDEHVLFPGNKPNALWFYETKDTFLRSSRIHLVKQFGEISVYRVDLRDQDNAFLKAPILTTTVGPTLTGGYHDQAAQEYPNYMTSGAPSVIYPIRNLIDRYDQLAVDHFTIASATATIQLGNIPEGFVATNWDNKKIYPDFLPVDELATEKKSTLTENHGANVVTFPIISGKVPVNDISQQQSDHCYFQTPNPSEKAASPSANSIRVSVNTCVHFSAFTTQDMGYLLLVDSRYIDGPPARLCVRNMITERCDVYAQLSPNKDWTKQIFVIPPYPVGYSPDARFDISFDPITIGKEKSEHEIRSVQLITFPYYRLTHLSFIDPRQLLAQQNAVSLLESKQVSPYRYTATIAQNGSLAKGYIVLDQAYEDGWKAYVVDGWLSKTFPILFGKAITNHIVVNNWANEWEFDTQNVKKNPAQIVIIFVPQYLEFFGFLLLLVPFIYFFYPRRKESSS